MQTDTRKQQLLDQQLALSAYLDALLHQASQQNRPETDEAQANAAVCPQSAGMSAEHTAVDAKAGLLQGGANGRSVGSRPCCSRLPV